MAGGNGSIATVVVQPLRDRGVGRGVGTEPQPGVPAQGDTPDPASALAQVGNQVRNQPLQTLTWVRTQVRNQPLQTLAQVRTRVRTQALQMPAQ